MGGSKIPRLAAGRASGKFLRRVLERPPQVSPGRRVPMGAKSAQKYSYDYPRPALTVDVVLATREDRPRVLLIRRKHDPFAGSWALPGGFVDEGEKLADTARRELKEETGHEVADIEQLYTAGDPGRDP